MRLQDPGTHFQTIGLTPLYGVMDSFGIAFRLLFLRGRKMDVDVSEMSTGSGKVTLVLASILRRDELSLVTVSITRGVLVTRSEGGLRWTEILRPVLFTLAISHLSALQSGCLHLFHPERDPL